MLKIETTGPNIEKMMLKIETRRLKIGLTPPTRSNLCMYECMPKISFRCIYDLSKALFRFLYFCLKLDIFHGFYKIYENLSGSPHTAALDQLFHFPPP